MRWKVWGPGAKRAPIRFPNKAIKDEELLFFDPYYGIAILEILVDIPLRCPSFVSSPEYEDKVFVSARDEDSSLLTTYREGHVSQWNLFEPQLVFVCELCASWGIN
jgi:hypothetical protein